MSYFTLFIANHHYDLIVSFLQLQIFYYHLRKVGFDVTGQFIHSLLFSSFSLCFWPLPLSLFLSAPSPSPLLVLYDNKTDIVEVVSRVLWVHSYSHPVNGRYIISTGRLATSHLCCSSNQSCLSFYTYSSLCNLKYSCFFPSPFVCFVLCDE